MLYKSLNVMFNDSLLYVFNLEAISLLHTYIIRQNLCTSMIYIIVRIFLFTTYRYVTIIHVAVNRKGNMIVMAGAKKWGKSGRLGIVGNFSKKNDMAQYMVNSGCILLQYCTKNQPLGIRRSLWPQPGCNTADITDCNGHSGQGVWGLCY